MWKSIKQNNDKTNIYKRYVKQNTRQLIQSKLVNEFFNLSALKVKEIDVL